MATTIITKNGSGAPTADDLSVGELAVDLTNKRLYSKNSSSEVIELGVNTASSLDVTGTVTADGLTVDGGSVNNDSSAVAGKFNANGNEHIRLEISTDSTIGNQAALDLVSNSNTSRIYTTGSTGLKFSTDGGTTTHAVIDGSGNVGIGTSSPALPLDVVANSSANALSLRTRVGDDYSFLTFRSNDGTEDLGGPAIYRSAASTSNLLFYTNNGGSAAERMRIDSSGDMSMADDGEIFFNASVSSQETRLGWKYSGTLQSWIEREHSDGSLVFGNQGSERMRIDSSGHAIIPAGVTLGTAAGTYNAANTLDDYEEGSFTPTVIGSTTAGTATYSHQKGLYTKIGRVCTVQVYLNWSGGSGTGVLQIGGLPFTLFDSSGFYPSGTIGEYSNITGTAGHTLCCIGLPNTTTVQFAENDLSSAPTTTSYDAAGYIIFSMTYLTT